MNQDTDDLPLAELISLIKRNYGHGRPIGENEIKRILDGFTPPKNLAAYNEEAQNLHDVMQIQGETLEEAVSIIEEMVAGYRLQRAVDFLKAMKAK